MKPFSFLSAVLLTGSILLSNRALAGSATWNLNPTSANWNTAANWTPNTVPNSPSDTASFDVSNSSNVTLSSDTSVAGIVFNSGASAYNINTGVHVLSIYNAGVINNSGSPQEFVLPVDSSGDQGWIQFFNSATAGTDTAYTVQGSVFGSLGGVVSFSDTSTADGASFVIEGPGGTSNTAGGRVQFLANSTAGNANFVVNPGVGISTRAFVAFDETANGGNAIITANGSSLSTGGGGLAFFGGDSDAGNATVIANGTQPDYAAGTITFTDAASGGNAQIKLFGTGTLDITAVNHPALTIGSLEGDGDVTVGGQTLAVGRNNLSRRFDGVISGPGSLMKIGNGRFTLTNANTYTGGTTVQHGTVILHSKIAESITGPGKVTVNGGKLKGNGVIAGDVLVGSGSGPGAVIEAQPAHGGVYLTLQKRVIMNSDATYRIDLDSDDGSYGSVIAKGVTINNASFAILDSGNSSLAGVELVVINNNGTAPISGTFSNLPDGGTIVVGPNIFQANYEGGDGNDLTLTVVND